MRALRLLTLLSVVLAWAGCDSGGDLTDAERIVGQWETVSLNVQIANAAAVPLTSLEGNGDLLVTSRGEFEMDVRFGSKVIIPNTDVTVNLPSGIDLTGTYQLDDTARTLTVTRGARSATFGYDLSSFLGGADLLQFVADSPEEAVALLDLDPADVDAFFSVATGASISFRRATN